MHEEDEELVEFRRRLDWHEKHGTGATFEMIREAMLAELDPPRGRGRLRLVG